MCFHGSEVKNIGFDAKCNDDCGLDTELGSVGPLPWLNILNGYDDDNLTDVFWPEICH